MGKLSQESKNFYILECSSSIPVASTLPFHFISFKTKKYINPSKNGTPRSDGIQLQLRSKQNKTETNKKKKKAQIKSG